ncbi:erythromycin esterase-like protein [Paenibacillus cellulosilyticus]|uniref:Erythromycin esterase-like protein n=1 Tax=Paenibacillus cellulosilyticus TaxID=375489 RepID=A0A2V2Z3L2_9BACL|nr:erythromycin esterase family protein [Paenibacillus cellulosilyticus]PWW04813.1 erythromycin esterase-like protein [Paenibacillus cellulosilyticus]QKS45933.1 erythromycin esterase family protein [Paenibacillus cellulosilyticus]
MVENEVLEAIRKLAKPYKGPHDAGAAELLEQMGRATFVLLGEASHGTSEFYTDRAALSKRLITEYGFRFIAVEGDWPACYTLNRYVKGYADAGVSAREALRDFERWPSWMWANREIVELAEWLRDYNSDKSEADKVGFYGIDMYSLWESMEAILEYLESKPGSDLEAARRAFECFEPHGRDEQRYGASSALFGESCEDEVIALLRKLQDKWQQAAPEDRESAFSTEMNALAVAGAESYYTTMIRQDADSWNIRDRHMVSALERLMAFHGEGARAIVWEHNTHIGDARATDMAEDGMVNVGQLLREKYGDKVFAVGYGTYTGTVIAGRSWGMELEVMPVPCAMAKSWEELLHRVGPDNKLLLFGGDELSILDEVSLGHRAIGVVYHPERERGNYVPSVLTERYDAFIYFDETTALSPLSREVVPV